MNQSELIERVAQATELNQAAAGRAVKAVVNTIVDALVSGEDEKKSGDGALRGLCPPTSSLSGHDLSYVQPWAETGETSGPSPRSCRASSRSKKVAYRRRNILIEPEVRDCIRSRRKIAADKGSNIRFRSEAGRSGASEMSEFGEPELALSPFRPRHRVDPDDVFPLRALDIDQIAERRITGA